VPYCPGGAACHPGAAAPTAGSAGVGGWCLGVRAGNQRVAAGPAGPPAGLLSGTMPGTGPRWPRHVRGPGHRRSPVGAAPLLRRLVRYCQTPQRRRSDGAVPPSGWVLACPACQHTGHRDLSAAANIAARLGGGITPVIPAGVTHRRAGAHLPGVAPSRRDPRRRAHHRGARGSPGRHRPAPASPT